MAPESLGSCTPPGTRCWEAGAGAFCAAQLSVSSAGGKRDCVLSPHTVPADELTQSLPVPHLLLWDVASD